MRTPLKESFAAANALQTGVMVLSMQTLLSFPFPSHAFYIVVSWVEPA